MPFALSGASRHLHRTQVQVSASEDETSCVKFAEEIKEKYGYDASAPNVGEIIEV